MSEAYCSSIRIPAPSTSPASSARSNPRKITCLAAITRAMSSAVGVPEMPISFDSNDPRWSKARIISGSVYPRVTDRSFCSGVVQWPRRVGLTRGGIPRMAISSGSQIEELLGDEAEALLSYQATGVDAAQIVAPGPDFIDRVVVQTDRTPP